MTLDDAVDRVHAAILLEDWRGVIKWEGRLEEMMEDQPDAVCSAILVVFSNAHRRALNSSESKDSALSVVRLESRNVEVLGKMQRFRDQGEALCRIADYLLGLGKRQESETYLQRARKIAEAHGFFSIECRSCLGLGKLARTGGREQEAVELLRNALACVPLFEEEDTILELDVLHNFTDALFDTHAIDEVDPLVARFHEVAKAESQKQGCLCITELHSLCTSARLHEVLYTYHPRVGPPSKADSVSHRHNRARIKTHVLVEAHALARHAGDLKRPRGRCALCSTSCATTRQQCKTRPINADTCLTKPARASISSTRSTGRRCSSGWWQPRCVRCLCGNQVMPKESAI